MKDFIIQLSVGFVRAIAVTGFLSVILSTTAAKFDRTEWITIGIFFSGVFFVELCYAFFSVSLRKGFTLNVHPRQDRGFIGVHSLIFTVLLLWASFSSITNSQLNTENTQLRTTNADCRERISSLLKTIRYERSILNYRDALVALHGLGDFIRTLPPDDILFKQYMSEMRILISSAEYAQTETSYELGTIQSSSNLAQK